MTRPTDPPMLNRATFSVLKVLFEAPEPLWFQRITRLSGLDQGVCYETLRGLKKREWVRTITDTELHPRRPARKLYTLSIKGRHQAESILGTGDKP